MQLEEGSIIEGRVTGIQKFGAFIDIGGGKNGMVHISEVSPTYVADINDFLKVGQIVKVKVISIDERGKVALSIKRALPPKEPAPHHPRNGQPGGHQGGHPDGRREGHPGGQGGQPGRDNRGGYNQNRDKGMYDKDKDAQPVRHYQQKKPVKKEEPDPEALVNAEYAYKPNSTTTDAGFEDMLSKFKSSSEDRMSDLKRSMDVKKRGSRRR
ncbi:MAG: S1 RNA-binding domain-containing protein [Oscillospiraceae bacterium]|nr:S1 RNA-binding domain-containing protein [Oscillospiraceae bacterium]